MSDFLDVIQVDPIPERVVTFWRPDTGHLFIETLSNFRATHTKD